jgi:anion-transporting  ArsA/GET3 family ATPase
LERSPSARWRSRWAGVRGVDRCGVDFRRDERYPRIDSMLSNLLDRRFVAVIGKGGTGRTTVSGALALLAASRGKRVLIAMVQAKERLSSMLETEFVGTKIQNLLGTIDAVNMEPDAALEEYGMMILRVRALYKAVMDNRVVKAFLRAAPGMDAWSMLGKALFHAKEIENGRPRYDLVILDAPATGHGLQMLRVPLVICDVAPPGLLRREAEEGLAVLRDPKASGVVVVTLPEEMPTSETEDLVRQLRGELAMPVAAMVVNQHLAPLFAGAYEPAARAAGVLHEVPAFAPLGRATRGRITREQIQARMMERLDALGLQRVVLPALAVERVKRAQMQSLARALADAGM